MQLIIAWMILIISMLLCVTLTVVSLFVEPGLGIFLTALWLAAACGWAIGTVVEPH